MSHDGGGMVFHAAEIAFIGTIAANDGFSGFHANNGGPHSYAGHGPQHGDGFANRYFRYVGGGTTGPNRPVQPTLPNQDGQVGLRVSCVMSLDGFTPASMIFIEDLVKRVNKRLFDTYQKQRLRIFGEKMARRFGLFVMTNAYMRGVNPSEPNQYFTPYAGLKSLNIASERPQDYIRPRGAEYKGAIGHTTRGVFQFGLVELNDLGEPLMVENVVRNGTLDARGNPTNIPGQRINPVRMYQFDRNLPSARVTLFMDTFEFALMVPAASAGRESKLERLNVGGGEVNAFINCIPSGWYLNPKTRRPGYPILAMNEVNLASRIMAEELFEMLHDHPFTKAEEERRLYIEEHYNNGRHSIRNTIELLPNTDDVVLTTGSQPVVEPPGYQAARSAGAALRLPSGVVPPPEPGMTKRP
ncbi:unnamed protein product [Sphagnum balticum]